MAAVMAAHGFDVIGVDVDPRAVDSLNRGLAPVQETGLGAAIGAQKERLRATLGYEEAVLASEATFVVVPTPSDDDGSFSLRHAQAAFREIGRALSHKDGYHVVVLTSTVLPGSTEFGLLPILERESGKVCGPDFGLCYSPEFIALGTVLRDLLNPDFTLVGEFDERSGQWLEDFYSRVIENGAACKRMGIVNAELAKIALNTFVTMKITFANTLADLCERIPGGDVDVVTDAIGSDGRVGPRCLAGGLGYGGPCFPRDNVALARFARSLDSSAPLAEETDRYNRKLPERTVRRLLRFVRPGARVAVLGLAYKPMSHVVDESQAARIANVLASAGADVVAYDPLVADPAPGVLAAEVEIAASLGSCVESADVIVVATPDPEFLRLRDLDLSGHEPPVVVIDLWRLLDGQLSGDVEYVAAGRSIDDVENAAALSLMWGDASTAPAESIFRARSHPEPVG